VGNCHSPVIAFLHIGAMTPLILAAGVLLLAGIHVASIVIALARLRRPAGTSRTNGLHGVSIVRPVCGLENFAHETLGSSFALDHPLYEVIFCVAHAADPVVPLVRRLIADHPHVPARLLIGNNRISTNPKLNNMLKGCAAARHPWLVMCDSNVLMPPDYVARLFAAWQRDAGLVCSPPIGCAAQGFWAELECAFLNTYQARWQYAADAFGLGFAQGKTMLWHREVLDAGGGMQALASEPAEDAAATKLVRRLGLRVRVVGQPFPQPLGTRTFAEVWRRQLRWARLRRDTFRVFFIPEALAGAIAPLLAVLALAAAADWPIVPAGLLFLAAWYGTEAMLARGAGWPLSLRSPVAWMARDAILPVLWLASWAGNEFTWRGNAMTLDKDGPSVVTEPQWKSVSALGRRRPPSARLRRARTLPVVVRRARTGEYTPPTSHGARPRSDENGTDRDGAR